MIAGAHDLDRHHAAVARANAAYARAIDDGRLDDWPAFFAVDCRYVVTTADNLRDGYAAGLIYCDSRNMLLDRVSALREANVYERHRYRHIIGAPYITESSDDLARSETPFIVARIMRTGQTELFATGTYLDAWTFAGETPLLSERVVACDSSSIDTLLALPI